MEWRELRRAHRAHSARLGGFGDATTREFVHTVIHILQTRSPPHPSPRSGEGAPGRKPRRRSSQPMKAEGEHSNPDRERGPKPPPPERERESKTKKESERERERREGERERKRAGSCRHCLTVTFPTFPMRRLCSNGVLSPLLKRTKEVYCSNIA